MRNSTWETHGHVCLIMKKTRRCNAERNPSRGWLRLDGRRKFNLLPAQWNTKVSSVNSTVGSAFAFSISWNGLIPSPVEGATRAVVVVEAAHTPIPATITVAAMANKLVLRI